MPADGLRIRFRGFTTQAETLCRVQSISKSHFRRIQGATYARSLNESQPNVQTGQFSVTVAKGYWGGLWRLPAEHAEHVQWAC